MNTRHRPKTKCGSQSIDICNSGHKTQTEDKKMVPNLETYVTLETRHGPKTKKNGSQSRDICNSGHKTQTEDKKWFPV